MDSSAALSIRRTGSSAALSSGSPDRDTEEYSVGEVSGYTMAASNIAAFNKEQRSNCLCLKRLEGQLKPLIPTMLAVGALLALVVVAALSLRGKINSQLANRINIGLGSGAAVLLLAQLGHWFCGRPRVSFSQWG